MIFFYFLFWQLKKTTIFASSIDQWCNGSTTVFGTVSLGSNPSWLTKTLTLWGFFVLELPFLFNF